MESENSTKEKQEKTIRQPIVTVCGHVDHGKCVAGDTMIPLAQGNILTAKEIFEKNYDEKKAVKEGTDIYQEVTHLKLFSKKEGNVQPLNASHIWKRQKKELIEIKTAHGDIIKTTPEHPFFCFSMDGEKKIRAENLKKGEYIAIPKKIKTKDNNPKKVILDKLKKHNFLCYLNKNAEGLLSKIKNKGYNQTEKKLSIKNLRDSIVKKRIRFQDLIKLGKEFRFNESQIYEMINQIKNSSIKQRAGHTSKPVNLPELEEPKKLGYILGCIAGDGHLDKTRVLLDNNDKEIHERYSKELKEVFNQESKIIQNHTCKTVVNEGGLSFKRIIKDLLDIPDKKKSQSIIVPEIAQTNKEIFKGFFEGLIETDGYISHLNNSIELTSKSRILIKQCSILLLNFNIQTTVYEKKGFWTLRIANKTYLKNFMDNFNLTLTRKTKRIIRAYEKSQSSRTFDIFPIPKEEIKKLNLPTKPNRSIPYYNKYMKKQNLTESFIKNVLDNVKKENETSKSIKEIIQTELRYVKVVSSKRIKNKEKYVYDFTIPKTHNFVAERTLLHNTTILDKLRKTNIQTGEAGGITQNISFTSYPIDKLKQTCPLIEKSGIKLNLPGFLFIDTPGHAAFTNLRKRGGSLADLAILIIDINEGIKPQTAEVIQILKRNKTPFLIVLNKIDNISEWRLMDKKEQGEKNLKKHIEEQPIKVKQNFDEKYMTLIGALNSYGLDADLYYNIKDFSKKIALVPCSAEHNEGISELVMVMCGLSQKYLSGKIKLGNEPKGVILEVKKSRTSSHTEAIIHDGELSVGDEIAIANFQEEEPIITKIRSLEEILPLSTKFVPKNKVQAATGIKMQLTEKKEALPGMPFTKFNGDKKRIKQELQKEITENINSMLKKQGVIAKADSLGSLEALLSLLNQNNIPVIKAGIGNINKKDIISAKANLDMDEINAVVVGFNNSMDEEAKQLNKQEKIQVFIEEVIYKLIEKVSEYRKNKASEIEKRRIMSLATIGKIEILHKYVFRNTNPAIFGIRVIGGKIKSGNRLVNQEGEKVGQIKKIQSENQPVQEAKEGMEVAISLPGINFERQINKETYLYSSISESQYRKFKKNKDLLSSQEIKILQEIANFNRRKNPEWGM